MAEQFIEIKLDQGDLQSTVNRLAVVNRKVRDGVRREVSRYALFIQGEARRNVPRATSRLFSSILIRFTMDRMGAIVSTNTNYAADVEYGTPPHIAPIDNLTDWVRVKIIANWKAARKIAHAVQWAISQKGTKPQPYMTPAAEKYKPRFFEAIRKVVKQA